VAVRRIEPNILSEQFDESRSSYNGSTPSPTKNGSATVFVRDPNGAVINVTQHRD
jgi:hypothetical protein